MGDQQDARGGGPEADAAAALDPEQFAEIAERSRRILSDFLDQHASGDASPDPLNIGQAFVDLTTRMMQDPTRFWELQTAYWREWMDLWQVSARRFMGEEVTPSIQPKPGDRRFTHEDWSEHAVFDFLKQSYLLTSRFIENAVQETEGLDPETERKVEFYTRQFVDAMSPSNFALTNPEVLRATIESKGENLVRGLENLLSDLERGKGRLHVRMTDEEAFEVGKNLAVTPGKVVFRNELMELLQYAPTTDTVRRRPLLIIPPWINKFYILDLRENNSLIRWAVSKGHTVFVISWVNPDSRLARKTFEDYMTLGPLAALDAIEQATGEAEANVVGYCLGGTLLACTLAWLAATGNPQRVASATYLATLTDFAEAGDLQVFIDDAQLAALEERMSRKGYLEGADMATTFNMLRANDLIWSFVINNYLLGKEPFPFDLLYWNSDSTRMPAAMHIFYLRNMYQRNLLVEPGGITLKGVPIDLGSITTPTFILSTREDHIAPWKATYRSVHLYGGPRRFVLSGSGHIAGVVNPEGSEKYGYWTYGRYPKDPEKWLEKATQKPGSWWPEWDKWIGKFSGGKVDARHPGDGALEPLDDAPGTYVLVRSQDE